MKLSDRNEQANLGKQAQIKSFRAHNLFIIFIFLFKSCTKTETCRFSTGTENRGERRLLVVHTGITAAARRFTERLFSEGNLICTGPFVTYTFTHSIPQKLGLEPQISWL